MGNNMKLIRWIALLAVMAMVAVACASDEDAAETTTTTTTEAPVTTAPPADTGDDEPTDMPDEETTTTTTTAPPADDPEPPAELPAVEGYPLSVSIFSEPTTSNPWAAYDTESDVWTSYVNPGNTSLYTYSFPSYTLVPGIAADPTPPPVVADGDNWSVTVNIDEGPEWTDGTPITAHDVQFTWDTIDKYDGLGGNFSSLWPSARADDPDTDEDETNIGVLDVEALSDTQVKITFNADVGLAVWPFKVGVAIVLQKAYWEPHVLAADEFEELYAVDAIGYSNASSFVSTQWEEGAFWRNEAIPDYWAKGAINTAYASGAVKTEYPDGTVDIYGGDASGEVLTTYEEGPFPSEITYSLYSDQNSAILALQEGEVSFMLNSLGLQRGLQSLVFADPNLEVVVNQPRSFRYMAFNLRKFPMSDLSFREAVACRIDKDFMAETVFGGAAIPISTLVPQAQPYWASPDIKPICDGMDAGERLAESVKILKDGGWTWDVEPEWEGGAVVPKGEGLTGPNGEKVGDLELLAPGPGYDPLRATYSLFVETWMNELGFSVQADPTAFSVIVDKVSNADDVLGWDMFMLGWSLGLFPSYVFNFFTAANDSSLGGVNRPGYNNPDIEELSIQFDTAKTLDEARDIIRQAEAIIAEDLPYIVLLTTPIIEVYRNNLVFPYTETLNGLQSWLGGLFSSVTLSE